MKQFIVATAPAFTALGSAQAQQKGTGEQAALPWVRAEVKTLDLASGRLILRHDEIPNLDMPGMTMGFRLSDPKLAEGVKAGDAVRVTIDKVKGQLSVIRLEVLR